MLLIAWQLFLFLFLHVKAQIALMNATTASRSSLVAL